MNSFFSPRAHVRARFTPLTLSVAILAAFPSSQVFSQGIQAADSAQVFVVGSRFSESRDIAPIGATVITAKDIRDAGVDNVNQAIRKIGGVFGRQSAYGTQDFDLDLRGFGTNSSQNMVILVDGIRLSENELSVALLSSIPIDSVARIEIMRGGSSVLYGDGATAGVIQIITKQAGNKTLSGVVTAELGQFKHKELRASLAQVWGNLSANLNLSEQKADNYRDNNAVDQKNINAGLVWAYANGRLGARIDSARQESGFAGALSLAQFEQNPRQTLSPKNFGSIDTDRFTAFADQQFGAWEMAAELSRRNKTSKSFYSSSYGDSAATYTSHQTQFSPRIRNVNAGNELTVGVDLIRWDRLVDSSYSQADASQKSKAIYLRDEIRFNQARVAVGARREIFDKVSINPAAYSIDSYAKTFGLNAWELQGSYAVTPTLNLFAKTGQSYRVANVDENGFTPIANTPLQPQTSHDIEIGATFGDAKNLFTTRVFRSNLKNEIFYDPTATNAFFGKGANVNLDPTKRQGIELELATQISADFAFNSKLQHLAASFTEGVNAGKGMVMVPKNLISMNINWLPKNGQSANVGLQWVDEQRYGGDFSNTCTAKMPGYTTLDARYAKSFGALELALSGTNLGDKQYFSNAYGCKSGIYPNSGRQLKISARYEF
ncbi:TonB-dependent receptor [Undibacterium parvum]|uniref:TonB-dependent receptor n=1 Tax=Undibacterium parvum TaxID=401471 RepID=A0A3Q9BUE2_9BURK|nr:TonB-dependent receptor [Undibacterium parvum]AZP14243.1 TonB-dependent receptor [Undibacterium parvum]